MCVCVCECVSKYTWWGRSWGTQECHAPALEGQPAVPVPALEVGDRALSWGPLVLMRGMALTWVLSLPSPVLARGTRAGRVGAAGAVLVGGGGQARTRGCQSHDHYPAPTTRLSISVFPLPSLITHIPHPAPSLLRPGEGGGGGAPTPSPGGGSTGLGEGGACGRDTVQKGDSNSCPGSSWVGGGDSSLQALLNV